MRDIALLITVVLVFSVTAIDGAPRVKRQTIFTVADRDSSFPCDGPEAKLYAALGLPFVELTNEQKLDLMHQLGGEFLHAYMSFDGSAGEERLRNALEPNGRRLPKPDVTHRQFASTQNVNPADEQPLAPSHHSAPTDDTAEEVSPVKECSNRTQAYKSESDKYRRMCTTCSTKHLNAPDIWPEVFYEAECEEGQMECLYDSERAHGQCQQNTMEAYVLHKQPKQCVTLLADGGTVVTNEWLLYPQVIKAGCECAVEMGSKYS